MDDKKVLVAKLVAVTVFLVAGLLLLNHFDREITDEPGLENFGSSHEMAEFLRQTSTEQVGSTLDARASMEATDEVAAGDVEVEQEDADYGVSDDLYQGDETVVQVAGIDEPDMVKTDGERLFYQGGWSDAVNTSVLDIGELEIEENISSKGSLLLDDEMLYVVGSYEVTAYSIESYEEEWSTEFEQRIDESRLRNGEIVLVLSETPDYGNPCPMPVAEGVSIPCTGIIRPGFPTDSETVYSFLSVETDSGDISEKQSFVGDRGSEFYISEKDIFFTYTNSEKRSEVFFDFLLNHASIDGELRERFEEVSEYDLSEQSYNTEIDVLMGEWVEENEDEAEQLEEELENYLVERKREHHETTVARLDNSFELVGEETVPGELSDRMSMHHDGEKFYIVTDVEPGYSVRTSYTNDLTVFNEGFEVEEVVEDVSEDRRSEVAFRGSSLFISSDDKVLQYGLDGLEIVNEFESSAGFLFPAGEKVISVGREIDEDRYLGNLTVTIFDSNDGEVIDREVMDERFSRVTGDMAAFQLDGGREKFFVPTSGDGKVFDYSDGLEYNSVNFSSSERAFFLDELLVVGRSNVKTFDYDYEETGSFEFPSRSRDYVESRVEEEVATDLPQ